MIDPVTEPDEVAVSYEEALRGFLEEGGEAALSVAYDLGRRAAVEGGGIMQLAEIHHRALAALGSGADPGPRIEKAAAFFAEAISPLEMALRGFKESNESLRELNARLEEQNVLLDRSRRATQSVNEELEAFSYSVAHDLRAPLRSIDGFSQALMEDYAEELDPEALSYLGYVREAATEMGQLIEGLLALSRLAREPMSIEHVELSELAARVVAKLRRSEPARRVEVTIAPGLGVEGDRRMLTVLFDNLLGNAWKFTARSPAPHIEVGRQAPSEGGRLFVRDNGAGFDPALSHKLFGVFQRLHSAEEFEGTGIGLATVRRVVHRHGGEIHAEAAPGRGATFLFTLSPEAETETETETEGTAS